MIKRKPILFGRLVVKSLLLILPLLTAHGIANAATLTVCSSGCDQTTIQAAVDAATSGDTIRVATGTYTENISLGSSSNTNITFEGGYNSDFSTRDVSAYETTISGYIRSDANYAGTFTVDGFTITSSVYSAIYTQNSAANVTVNNCKLHGNAERGVYVYNVDTATITNNTIYSNGTGGGSYDYGIWIRWHTSITISGNTIYSNPDGGILLTSTENGDSITGNTIYSNSGSGVKMTITSTSTAPTISTNTIYLNGDDGIYISGGSPNVTNNIVYSNTSDGIYISATNSAMAPVVNNNTVAKNGDDGIDIYDDGTPTVNNNILYKNDLIGIHFSTPLSGSDANPVSVNNNSFFENGNAELSHTGQSPYSYHNDTPGDSSDINSPSWASGNYYLDPSFTDEANDDYTLASTSYLIDGGDPDDSYANEPSDNGNRINVGAYGNTSSATTKPASPTVSNVSASQSGGTVTITFDTGTATAIYDIIAEYWNGTSYQTFVPDTGLSDAQRIDAGTGQFLTWDGSEMSESEYSNSKIRITASREENDSVNGVSSELTLDFNTPTVSISAPSAGTVVSTTPPTFTATASDSGSGIASVKFQYKLSTDSSYTDLNTDTTSSYAADWSTVTLATGSTYDLRAVATDGKGNSTDSSTVSYTAGQPTVDFSSSTYSGAEEGGTSSVTVQLDGTSSETVTVDYASSDGTATAGSDYTAVSGTLTFSAGETSKTFTVTPTDDGADDDGETINLTLSNASNATLGSSNNPSTFTIVDGDGEPTVDFSGSTYSGTESGGAITVTVSLSNSSSNTITIDYASSDGTATAGTDYTAVSGTLTFSAGDTSKTFTVTPTDDSSVEEDETVTLTLSNASNTTLANNNNPATLTITNDDSPTVDFSASTYSGAEDGGTITVTVSLSASSSSSITVDYASSDGTATAGTDYTAVSGTLTFSAGDTSKTFIVTPTNDSSVESDETVTLTLSNPSGATLAGANSPATLTIRDNDMPTVDFSTATISGNENGGDITVTVNLSESSPKTVTVYYASSNGTAVAGTDYTAVSGTLSFGAGFTSKTFTVTPVYDSANEENETITLTLSNPSNATLGNTNNPATVTIVDDDDDTAAPTISSNSPSSGGTGRSVKGLVTATFSEAMDSATITGSTFTLTGGSSVAGTVSYSGKIATFTPSADLSYSTSYTATVTTGAKDTSGNALAADHTWSFTTEVQSDSSLTAPTGLSATSLKNRIRLSWSAVSSIDGNDISYGYRVYYGTSSGIYNGVVDAGKHTASDITGLENGTTYYFAVAFYSGSSQSDKSSEVSAAPSALPRIISGPEVSFKNDKSAKIKWRTDEKATSVVNYGTTSSYGQTSSSDTTRLNHSVMIKGLTAGTTYHYQASSTNSSSNTVNSSDKTFTTDTSEDTTAPKVIAGPILTFRSSDRATIYWKTDEPSNSRVNYGIGVSSENSVLTSDYIIEHEITVTGLSADTKYTYGVVSTDASGNISAQTADREFTTPSTADSKAPVIVEGPLPIAVTPTSAVIFWKTDEASSYTLEYGSSSSYGTTISSTDATLKHTVLIMELVGETEYHYRITSSDGISNTATTGDYTFSTALAADSTGPVFVEGPYLHYLTDLMALIYWKTDEPADTKVEYGTTTNYGSVYYKPAFVKRHTAVLTNLVSNTSYSFSVSSTDPEGNSTSATTFSSKISTGMYKSLAPGDSSFSTSTDTDSSAPTIGTGPSVTFTSDTTAVVEWTTDEASDSAVYYGTQTVVISGATTSVVDTESVTGHSLTVTNLSPSTEYHYKAASTDPSGNGPTVSNDATFTTLSSADSTAPVVTAGPTVTISGGNATVAWTTDELSDSRVNYGLTSSYGNTASDTERVTSHSILLTGLGLLTTYHYQIISADPDGNSYTSSDLTFTTAQYPAIDFSSGSYSLDEAVDQMDITVNLSNVYTETITVDYASSDGTATAGTDYTAVSGTLNFNAGETSSTFTVSPLSDDLDEEDKTVTLTLSNPTNSTVGTDNNPATLTIVDDDPLPTVDFCESDFYAAVTWMSSQARIVVNLSVASGRAVTVNYATSDLSATAGSDYTSTSGTLTFNPGATTKDIYVSIVKDTNASSDERFWITLSSPSNASLGSNSPAQVTITTDTTSSCPVPVIPSLNSYGLLMLATLIALAAFYRRLNYSATRYRR